MTPSFADSRTHIFEPDLEVLDTTTVKEFKRQISAQVEPGRCLVLDLQRIHFIDSSGLGAILSTSHRLNAVGGELKVCSLTPTVRVLFELVRLHKVFDVLNTREEALDLATTA